MKVRVISAITSVRGVIPAGAIIDVQESLLSRLFGKVELLPTSAELEQLIGEKLAKIDQAGKPWTGWRQSLPPEHHRQLIDIENRIDSTCCKLDRHGLLEALQDYRKCCLGNMHISASE